MVKEVVEEEDRVVVDGEVDTVVVVVLFVVVEVVEVLVVCGVVKSGSNFGVVLLLFL